LNLLNYSAADLKEHLERLFTRGMTWDRLLRGDIEIDHIIPVSFFNPPDEHSLEFKMCWSLNNLQPLWKEDNRAKRDILPDNFTQLWNQLYEEAIRR
jgi:5-methylcytosine-specific restriction endonuclease McrA